MRLWLTRDPGSEVSLIWCGDSPPVLDDDTWVGGGTEYSVSQTDYECDPGTRTELFTEQQVRNVVDNILLSHSRAVGAYCWDRTDANWARLMAEVKP